MPMKPTLRVAFEAELRQAVEAEQGAELPRAWRHLERAHILSQAHAGPHIRVHVLMFTYGWRRGDMREMLGQFARILLAGPGSWLGRAPLGNTGGANVGILTPMRIPEDLQALLES